MANDVVVFLSGGLGSFLAAEKEFRAGNNPTLLFTDTMIEDPDLYRFLDDIEQHIGVEIIRIADGRTPWQVFRDVRMIGNSRVDPCSRILKRDLARAWIDKHAKSSRLVFGIGLQESHRTVAISRNWAPHQVSFPLIDEEVFDVKRDAIKCLRGYGIEPPRLYDLGFSHNNCGGFCVKAGHAHFVVLLERLPELFLHHEEQEEAMRGFLGRDVSILRDRRGGESRPLTLREFRHRVCAGGRMDLFDVGGCGCFL